MRHPRGAEGCERRDPERTVPPGGESAERSRAGVQDEDGRVGRQPSGRRGRFSRCCRCGRCGRCGRCSRCSRSRFAPDVGGGAQHSLFLAAEEGEPDRAGRPGAKGGKGARRFEDEGDAGRVVQGAGAPLGGVEVRGEEDDLASPCPAARKRPDEVRALSPAGQRKAPDVDVSPERVAKAPGGPAERLLERGRPGGARADRLGEVAYVGGEGGRDGLRVRAGEEPLDRRVRRGRKGTTAGRERGDEKWGEARRGGGKATRRGGPPAGRRGTRGRRCSLPPPG